MILHASFPVGAPRDSAETLAQLMAGEAFPLPEFGEDAWIAMSGDDHGTLVGFLQRGTEFHDVPGGTVEHRRGEKTRESGGPSAGVPADLSTDLSAVARSAKAETRAHRDASHRDHPISF